MGAAGQLCGASATNRITRTFGVQVVTFNVCQKPVGGEGVRRDLPFGNL